MESTYSEYVISLAAVYTVGVVLPLAALVITLMRAFHYRRLERTARWKEARINRLESGRAVISGVVEVENPAEPAISLRIEQKGEDLAARRGGAHRWTEVRRSMKVNPFQIALPYGERVEIEADDTIELIHDAVMTERRSIVERDFLVEIWHGERVTVVGALEKDEEAAPGEGYRGAKRHEILKMKRSSAGELTAATQPLHARYTRWTCLYSACAAVVIAAILFINLGLFRSFHALTFSGVVYSGRIASVLENGRDKGGPLYAVLAVFLVDPGQPVGECSEVVHLDRARAVSKGQAIPILALPSNPSINQFGPYPVASALRVAAVLWVFGLAGAAHYRIRKELIRWYDQKIVTQELAGRLLAD